MLIVVFFIPLSALQDSVKLNAPSLGNIYFNKSANIFQSDIDSAIYYMELAYPLLKQEKDWPKYIECFSALSFFHHTNYDFDKFRSNAEMALVEAEKYLEPNDIKFADIFNNLYAYQSLIGNNKKGISSLQKSLEIRQKNNESDFQLSTTYQNLGTAYSRLGDSKKSIEYLKQSIDLRIKSDSVPEYDAHYADSYSCLADAYNLAGDNENSILYYKKSLSILGHEKCQKNQLTLNLKIIALLQLAENLIQINNLKEADSYLKQVFLLHDEGIEIRLPTSLYLSSLLNYKKGNYSGALSQIQYSNRISLENNNEASPPLLAKRYKLLGDIYKMQNKLDSAIHAYNEGLSHLAMYQDDNASLDHNLNYSAILAQPEALNLMLVKSKCLQYKAQKINNKLAWQSCFKSYLNAIRLIREMRSGIETAESKNILADKSMEVYEQALDVAFQLIRFDKDEKILQNIFEIIESNKALLLFESYNKHLAQGVLDIPREILNEEYDLNVDLAYYSKEISLEKRKKDADAKKIKDLEYKHQQINQKYDSLVYSISKISPDFNQYKNQITPVSLSQLKSNLKESNSVILEFFSGSQFLFLMVINNEKIEFLKLDNENLLSQIDALHNELSFEVAMTSGNEGFERFYDISNKLYLQLIKPAIPYFETDQSNIIIIPDGYISSIPFDILVTGHNEDVEPSYSPNYLNYLIKDYNIGYSYSSTLFSKDQIPSKQNALDNLVAYAPVFGGNSTAQERSCECDGIQLEKLSCNVTESASIVDLFSGQLYSNELATKNEFLTNANKYNVIHIASHACIDQEDGMLNQIFFSDGGISNYELYNSKLSAELTVLSACNTGIGEIQNGEGVLNLAKGFLMAGSKSALMSLWSVNDCTTSKLMELFYSNLKKGNSRNESMRQTKINFLTNASKLHAHPYYWGAFVHYGKNKPLNTAGDSAIFYWGFIILLLSLVGFFFRKRKRSNQ